MRVYVLCLAVLISYVSAQSALSESNMPLSHHVDVDTDLLAIENRPFELGQSPINSNIPFGAALKNFKHNKFKSSTSVSRGTEDHPREIPFQNGRIDGRIDFKQSSNIFNGQVQKPSQILEVPEDSDEEMDNNRFIHHQLTIGNDHSEEQNGDQAFSQNQNIFSQSNHQRQHTQEFSSVTSSDREEEDVTINKFSLFVESPKEKFVDENTEIHKNIGASFFDVYWSADDQDNIYSNLNKRTKGGKINTGGSVSSSGSSNSNSFVKTSGRTESNFGTDRMKLQVGNLVTEKTVGISFGKKSDSNANGEFEFVNREGQDHLGGTKFVTTQVTNTRYHTRVTTLTNSLETKYLPAVTVTSRTVATEYLQPAVTTKIISSVYVPPKTVTRKTVRTEYLPPTTVTRKTVRTEYLPPTTVTRKTVRTEYLPPTTVTKETVRTEYLPPKTITRKTVRTEYLPPTTVTRKTVRTEYLPPTTATRKTVRTEYLPPPTVTRKTVRTEYLPPVTVTSRTVRTEYLPPVTVTSKTVKTEYLPPVTVTSKTVRTEYLPPVHTNNVVTTKFLPRLTITSKIVRTDFLPHPTITSTILETKYLPPSTITSTRRTEYIVPSTITNKLTIENLSYSTTIDREYLPPKQVTKVKTDYLPPSKVFSTIRREYLPPSIVTNTETIKKTIFVSQTLTSTETSTLYLDPKTITSLITRYETKRESKVDINYLPPTRTSTRYIHSSTVVRNLYLPPKRIRTTRTVTSLRTEYLPPVTSTVIRNYIAPTATKHFVTVATNYIRPTIPNRVTVSHRYTTTYGPNRNQEKLNYSSGTKIIPVSIKRPTNKPVSGSTNRGSTYINYGTNDRFRIRNPSPQSFSGTSMGMKAPPQYHIPQSEVSFERIPLGNVQVSYGSIPKFQCNQNQDCDYTDICIKGSCLDACHITAGKCIGGSYCSTVRHIPSCVCHIGFESRTRFEHGTERFDCIPSSTESQNIQKKSLRSCVRQVTARRTKRQTGSFFRHEIRAPIRGHSARPFSTRNTISTSSNPCQPSPCGPNTRCDVNRNDIAQCKCVEGYVPDGNTINGCKPQCVSDFECPDDYRCRQNQCVRVCAAGACGLNAECDARQHRARCSCPENYSGSPDVACNRNLPVLRNNPPAPPIDPCYPNPCGTNAECNLPPGNDRPVCSCPYGYEGNPLESCVEAECIESSDCPSHQACQLQKCIDPCNIPGMCGRGADCVVKTHQPVCSCPKGYTGDPFVNCRRFDPRELCEPSPCGDNTNCRVENDRAVCSCIDNYIGNPLTGCSAECIYDRDCNTDRTCRENRCVNPCAYQACGENSYCDVSNNRVKCTCPQFYEGNPEIKCSYECAEHTDCKSNQACHQLKCIDPCVGACGTGADCKVENHKPICSCPRGYTGHPFESCRQFTEADLCDPNPCGTNADCTPGSDRSGEPRPVCTCPHAYIGNALVSCQKGECERPSDCREGQTCHRFQCQDPCVTETGPVCGVLAECTVRNHQPVCACPPGYEGSPLDECYSPSARYRGRN